MSPDLTRHWPLGAVALAVAASLSSSTGSLRTAVVPARATVTAPVPVAMAGSLDVAIGRRLFQRNWVPSPASTKASDGLGPLFNARSCAGCHDPEGTGARIDASTLTMHFVPADPVYGRTLQIYGVNGVPAEGHLVAATTRTPVTMADGERIDLAAPSYHLVDLGYGAPDAGSAMSPRMPARLAGAGMLARVDAGAVLALADPDDHDGDGIAGRAQLVPNPATGQPELGRFGWKADEPDLRNQVARAFADDLGLSSPVLPVAAGDCAKAESRCGNVPGGRADDPVEIAQPMFDAVVAYVASLPAPKRHGAGDPAVRRGEQLFTEAGCAACHRPALPLATSGRGETPRVIAAYTDLLLHDMGDGLADRPHGDSVEALGWRTAPLWGAGQSAGEDGKRRLLHDGRATTFAEAIVWHGGEGAHSRAAFETLVASDRAALIAFLTSL